MKALTLFFTITFSIVAFGQEALKYTDSRGNTQLAGSIAVSDLESDELGTWYQNGYSEDIIHEKAKWSKRLKDMEVDIYMGTWCGDSKRWVPKFVKLWDELGLSRDQLNVFALYGGRERYKQGPNDEEKGMDIHRVPTFIFKEDGREIARIVESPSSDLVTDVAQIAMGYPSEPNYRGVSYLMDVLKDGDVASASFDFFEHKDNLRRILLGSSELNTLGYVYLYSDRLEEALITFKLNSLMFPFEPRVHNSYGRALELKGELVSAAECYERALVLEPENELAKNRLAALD